MELPARPPADRFTTPGRKKKAFRVSQWAQDWTRGDLLDDGHQYG